MSDVNFAPWTLKLFGTLRSRSSGSGLVAPSFASLSLNSFPSTPSWSFTHLKVVMAMRRRRRCAAFWKNGAFFTPIHPWSSQDCRWVVSPSMAYLESDIISIGWDIGTDATAIMMATISPTWFDCAGPGTLNDLLRGLPCPAQTPLPQVALLFPLFRQAPSVYREIFWQFGLRPTGGWRRAGRFDRRSGFMKTRNASARWLLQVIDGSKVIASLFCFAWRFLILHDGVRDRQSDGSSWPSGFHFGDIHCSFWRASIAHLWAL